MSNKPFICDFFNCKYSLEEESIFSLTNYIDYNKLCSHPCVLKKLYRSTTPVRVFTTDFINDYYTVFTDCPNYKKANILVKLLK